MNDADKMKEFYNELGKMDFYIKEMYATKNIVNVHLSLSKAINCLNTAALVLVKDIDKGREE